jgi:hypothetical protein
MTIEEEKESTLEPELMGQVESVYDALYERPVDASVSRTLVGSSPHPVPM